MKSLFVGISRAAMNGLYRLFCRLYTRDSIVLFLSRQADQASYDFIKLSEQISSSAWIPVMHLRKVDGRSMLAYAFHVFKELRLLAQCRLVVLDRYDPVISLLDFDETPIIVQLWHAFGAYKKFGYQSIDTKEGHLQQTVDTFSIHRNYTWIVASGENTRKAFAEAFGYPVERVIAFNRPLYYELLNLKNNLLPPRQKDNKAEKQVLFAPTLRKSKSSPHPFRDLYENKKYLEAHIPAIINWSFHPLEEGLPAPGNTNQALFDADLVVTDYSSLVYEAYLLEKPVIFYIPDIDTYLTSPGLNINPQIVCPELCAKTESDLLCVMQDALTDPRTYWESLVPFAAPAFNGAETAPSDLLATFIPRK